MNDNILTVKNLSVKFPVYAGIFKRKTSPISAINDISFNVPRGKTIGIVGESGCGKTTLAKTVMGITKFINNDIDVKGEILFHNNEMIPLNPSTLKTLRAKMQMIFQDPFSSLNPRMTIYEILKEPFDIHEKKMSEEIKYKKIEELITHTGILKEHFNRYPHEFSGGQRQRVAIARALALKPSLIIADEPVSALDVSVQAGILKLLKKLQTKYNLTYIFISHDLSVVNYIADTVLIMYLGKIVEKGTAAEIFNNPVHPYSRLLIQSVPSINIENKNKRFPLPDMEPSQIYSQGCPFEPRCTISKIECKKESPELFEISKTHFAACPYSG